MLHHSKTYNYDAEASVRIYVTHLANFIELANGCTRYKCRAASTKLRCNLLAVAVKLHLVRSLSENIIPRATSILTVTVLIHGESLPVPTIYKLQYNNSDSPVVQTFGIGCDPMYQRTP